MNGIYIVPSVIPEARRRGAEWKKKKKREKEAYKIFRKHTGFLLVSALKVCAQLEHTLNGQHNFDNCTLLSDFY